jgi:hypothetical protein
VGQILVKGTVAGKPQLSGRHPEAGTVGILPAAHRNRTLFGKTLHSAIVIKTGKHCNQLQ